ncbi:hypothetical protein MTO96_009824 [Rhipicephalus appendiculatus]
MLLGRAPSTKASCQRAAKTMHLESCVRHPEERSGENIRKLTPRHAEFRQRAAASETRKYSARRPAYAAFPLPPPETEGGEVGSLLKDKVKAGGWAARGSKGGRSGRGAAGEEAALQWRPRHSQGAGGGAAAAIFT